jgi:hypothetical protein
MDWRRKALRGVVGLAWTAVSAAGSIGGCKCGEDTSSEGGAAIVQRPLATDPEDPGATARPTEFPEALHTDDASLNAFVDQALSVCARGDYDGFRQLFAADVQRRTRMEFERVWRAAKEIEVAGLLRDRGQAPRYHLHAVLRWREPDSKGRLKRDAVVTISREGGEWRMRPAGSDVSQFMIGQERSAVSTRPALGGSPSDKPRND